jgi:hypothetical protein
MNKLYERLHTVAEITGDWTRSLLPSGGWTSFTGVRGFWNWPKGISFWPTSRPKGEGTEVNYDITRDLYRNSGENAFGGIFAKPIIDLEVAFIGIPKVSTGNEATDKYLNECLSVYWPRQIQQILRDSCRDSKAIVKITRPDVLDPLMTLDEADHCQLEIIAPELVDIERSLRNKNVTERAVIRRRMTFVIEEGSPTEKRDPRTEEHDVLEIIDRQGFRYFDMTEDRWLTDFSTPNTANMVPLLEAFNEWDTVLQGGQSDLETVIPFINAFHDLMTQGLQAHTYHSTPKVVMNMGDIAPFIKNNFPEAVDPNTGELVANAEISWRGREILFLQTEDKVEFLEATSVLGDTKILAEFLIDCICIASQTPEWAFMRVDSGSANSDRNAQTVPFIKKIERKRRDHAEWVQTLCKMALVIKGVIPVRPTVSWEMVRVDDEVVRMQAFQQLVMGLEVARDRGEISDETYQNMIRQFIPPMKSNQAELSEPTPLQLPSGNAPVSGGPQGRNE